jgi:hypothetical protein
MAASHNRHADDVHNTIDAACAPDVIGYFPNDRIVVIVRQNQRNFMRRTTGNDSDLITQIGERKDQTAHGYAPMSAIDTDQPGAKAN